MQLELNFVEVEPTVKGSKKNKLAKRRSNQEIFDFLYKGVKVPKLTQSELVQMNVDMLFGTDAYIGVGKIQSAVSELLRINLIKVGIHPKDAEEFVDEFDGVEGTTEALELLYSIFEAVKSKYEVAEEKVA